MNVWIRSVKILELLLSKVCKIAIIFQRMFLRLLPFSLLCIYIFVHVFDHVHSTYVMSACLSLGLSVCIYVYVCTCGWLHACIYLRKHVYIFTLWFAHLNIYKFSYKCRFVLVLLTLVIAIILLLSFSLSICIFFFLLISSSSVFLVSLLSSFSSLRMSSLLSLRRSSPGDLLCICHSVRPSFPLAIRPPSNRL